MIIIFYENYIDNSKLQRGDCCDVGSCLSDLNADGRRSIPNSSITNDNNHHLHQLQQLQIPQSVQNLVDDGW